MNHWFFWFGIVLYITFAHLSNFYVSNSSRKAGSGSPPKTLDSFISLLANKLFIFVFHLLFFIIYSSIYFLYSHCLPQVFSGELSLLHSSFIPSNIKFNFSSKSSYFWTGIVTCDWWVVDLFILLNVLYVQSSPWILYPTKDLLFDCVFPFVDTELCFAVLFMFGLNVTENWWAISGAFSAFFLWQEKLLFWSWRFCSFSFKGIFIFVSLKLFWFSLVGLSECLIFKIGFCFGNWVTVYDFR